MYGGRKGHCKWQIPQRLLYAFRHPRHMALWLVVTDQIPEPPHPLHRDFPVPWGSSCWLPPTYFSTDVAALILSSRSHVFEKYITTRNRRRPSTHCTPSSSTHCTPSSATPNYGAKLRLKRDNSSIIILCFNESPCAFALSRLCASFMSSFLSNHMVCASIRAQIVGGLNCAGPRCW